MDIYFHIPDFAHHLKLNLLLINSIHDAPELFHDGLKIASVFGTFPGMVWNGGRFLGGTVDSNYVKKMLEIFNSRNIPLRYTFTNPLIKKEHLSDIFCNQVMRLSDKSINEVIVMSPVVEEYIRENYPNYPITSSTCKQIRNMDDVNEELKKDYKYVVLDYNFNNKFDLLEQIPEEDRSRCEILVNACCIPNCPRRGEHYRTIGQDQINDWEHKKNHFNTKPYVPIDFRCESTGNTIYDITEFSTHVSPQDIFEKYLPMGFNNFKIEGRTVNDTNLLETYIYYMVKPEHKDKVRLKMLNVLTSNHKYFPL